MVNLKDQNDATERKKEDKGNTGQCQLLSLNMFSFSPPVQ